MLEQNVLLVGIGIYIAFVFIHGIGISVRFRVIFGFGISVTFRAVFRIVAVFRMQRRLP